MFAHAAQLLVMSWMHRSATIVLLIWVNSGTQADFWKLPPAFGPAPAPFLHSHQSACSSSKKAEGKKDVHASEGVSQTVSIDKKEWLSHTTHNTLISRRDRPDHIQSI